MKKQKAELRPMPERLWTVQETSEFLGIPVSTLYYWSYRGEGGPRVYKVGRKLRYDPADVMAWLEQQAA